MTGTSERGELPNLVSLLLGPMPRLPLAVLLTQAVRRVIRHRPELIERLGATARAPIAIIPNDLPFAFRIILGGERARVDVRRADDIDDAVARISGPLVVLLGLLDGTYDGDAVFFSRDLVIEGDTEHVLALRNTLEEADLSAAEFVGFSGSPAVLVNRGVSGVLAAARRILHAPPTSA